MADEAPRGIDPKALVPWFSEHVEAVDSLSVEIIGHGRSNLTYRVSSGDRHWVLRRPPLSHVQKSAHDMAREYRVLSALFRTDYPVPRVFAHCEDASVIGAEFFVMEFIDGFVSASPKKYAEKFTEPQRHDIGLRLVDGLVKLHRIDPLDIGLGDLGRPIGFLRRQVEQFVRQYDGVRFRDVPEFDELARRLAAAIPQEQNPGLVHGNFRIDNVVLDDCGQIIAVLDWEMCTYGDSLADLGLLQMYWGRSDDDLPPLAIGSSPVMELPGFPVWEEAIGRYREQVTVDLSQLDFYTVLAHFKLGVIVENMHKRYLAGGTVGKGFEFAGQLAVTLARRGLLIAERSSVLQLSG